MEAEPVADGALAHAEQVGDLVFGLAVVAPQQGGEAHGQAVVPSVLAAAFDLLSLRGIQRKGHGRLSPGCHWPTVSIRRTVLLLRRLLASRLTDGYLRPLMNDVTQILNAIAQGDFHAAEQLLPLVYDELRRLAAQKMAREKSGQ